MSLRQVPTAELWRGLLTPALEHDAQRLGYYVPHAPGLDYTIGAYGFPEWSGAVDLDAWTNRAMKRAGEALEAAKAAPAAVASAALAWARNELFTSYRELTEAYAASVRLGAETAGHVIQVLAERVAAAIEALGKGAGAAFRAFWGFPPIVPLAAGWVLLAGLLTGGIYLWSSGAVQPLLMPITRGVGRSAGFFGR